MQIDIYKITEDPKVYPKTLSDPVTITGSIRDAAVDVMRPVIMVQGAPADDYNYAWIPEFQRFYFMDPPESVRTGLIRLQMHVDVLQTYGEQIMTAPVILDRASSGWNTYLPDPRRKFFQYTRTQYITIKQNDLPGTNGDLGRPSVPILVTVG